MKNYILRHAGSIIYQNCMRALQNGVVEFGNIAVTRTDGDKVSFSASYSGIIVCDITEDGVLYRKNMEVFVELVNPVLNKLCE